MSISFYKINEYNTCISKSVWQEDEIEDKHSSIRPTEKNGYYKSYHKAEYVMLMNRLEKESMKKRQNKIKIRINVLLDEYPEAVI
jgi:hypothetical protein